MFDNPPKERHQDRAVEHTVRHDVQFCPEPMEPKPRDRSSVNGACGPASDVVQHHVQGDIQIRALRVCDHEREPGARPAGKGKEPISLPWPANGALISGWT
jgi:hypothetical protein